MGYIFFAADLREETTAESVKSGAGQDPRKSKGRAMSVGMKRHACQLAAVFAVVVTVFAFGITVAGGEKYSDVPPGLGSKGDWRPPGWSQGEKKGWNSDVPPGWEKWDTAKRQAWEIELNEAKIEIGRLCLDFRWTEDQVAGFMISFELACRSGVPIRTTRNFSRLCIRERVARQDMDRGTRALAYGVGQIEDFDGFELAVAGKLKGGARGDDLVRGMYLEVQVRAEKEKKEKEAASAAAAAHEKPGKDEPSGGSSPSRGQGSGKGGGKH